MASLRGKSLERLGAWEELDLNYVVRAHINQDTCIHCGLCYPACRDGGHNAIRKETVGDSVRYEVDQDACVGCNLCSLVCPVHECITMREPGPRVASKSWRELEAERS